MFLLSVFVFFSEDLRLFHEHHPQGGVLRRSTLARGRGRRRRDVDRDDRDGDDDAQRATPATVEDRRSAVSADHSLQQRALRLEDPGRLGGLQRRRTFGSNSLRRLSEAQDWFGVKTSWYSDDVCSNQSSGAKNAKVFKQLRSNVVLS